MSSLRWTPLWRRRPGTRFSVSLAICSLLLACAAEPAPNESDDSDSDSEEERDAGKDAGRDSGKKDSGTPAKDASVEETPFEPLPDEPLVLNTLGSAVPGNLFVSELALSEEEVEQKVTTAVNRFFGIGTTEPSTPTAASGYRVYYELPQDDSLAFIWAPDSDDVRSEGMSYGMMIAVQMDMKAQFDKLWNFSKRYMQYPEESNVPPWRHYFKWQGKVDTSDAAEWKVSFGATQVPAPDGDEYFAAALYLASLRWGSTGEIDYKAEADKIATAMLHNEMASSRHPIFHATEKMVVFVPYGDSNRFTDPSYHLPAFYELFADRGPAADAELWHEIAAISRGYLVQSAHRETGLHPDYAAFDGEPREGTAGDMHDKFRYDAWRVVMNMALDYVWTQTPDPRMRTQVEKYHAFFADHLGANNVKAALFNVDGSEPSGGGSTALTATLAAGVHASEHPDREKYLQALWSVPQQTGLYRYYQECVYLLGLLQASGRYSHTFAPPAPAATE